MSRRHALALSLLGGLLCGVGAARAQAQPVEGYVDLHSHLMAEHSFGGGWFWGTLEGPMDWAVRRCDGNFQTKSHAATIFPIVSELLGADTGWHLFKRRGYDRRHCRYFLGIRIPGTCPQPHFEDWPSWDTLAHQQMWQGWLQQAHQGGLQVMLVSLAESSFLCINTAVQSRRYGCDEMESVRQQAAFARDFAARNSGWVGIATSPGQARTLIGQGKLALVLSVEVTRLFPSGDFVAQLDELRALGVSSVQLTHHADNRFSGAAPIPKLMKAAEDIEALWALLGVPADLTDIDEMVCRDSAGNAGRCNGDDRLNERGLSAEGEALVGAMMDRGMLVDVAHVSRRSLARVYDLARQRGGYPLLYSHAHMWDTISPAEERHEKYIREDEIHMVASTGGMVGLRTGPEATQGYATPSPVDNRCPGTARSFAQSLMYAVDHGLNVGFGADLNGFIEQLKPRYSYFGCTQDWLDILQAGGPDDLQKKGMAHVGLLPALLADLQRVGVPGQYLEHLNHSAENFLQMWERSVMLGTNANLAPLAAASASSTYCSSPGLHCYGAARVNDGDRNTAVGGYYSWANAYGASLPQWVELSWSIPITVSRVDLYTSAGYALRDYDIEYWTSSGWATLVAVRGNTSVGQTHDAFAPIATSRLRVLGLRGPDNQPTYVRVNELEIY